MLLTRIPPLRAGFRLGHVPPGGNISHRGCHGFGIPVPSVDEPDVPFRGSGAGAVSHRILILPWLTGQDPFHNPDARMTSRIDGTATPERLIRAGREALGYELSFLLSKIGESGPFRTSLTFPGGFATTGFSWDHQFHNGKKTPSSPGCGRFLRRCPPGRCRIGFPPAGRAERQERRRNHGLSRPDPPRKIPAQEPPLQGPGRKRGSDPPLAEQKGHEKGKYRQNRHAADCLENAPLHGVRPHFFRDDGHLGEPSQ